MTEATRILLNEARQLLEPPVKASSSPAKAFMASIALAAAGLWLAMSMLIGPVLKPEPVMTEIAPAKPVKTVQAGSEGGFDLSSRKSEVVAEAIPLTDAQ